MSRIVQTVYVTADPLLASLPVRKLGSRSLVVSHWAGSYWGAQTVQGAVWSEQIEDGAVDAALRRGGFERVPQKV
jgi:hypothetical protein